MRVFGSVGYVHIPREQRTVWNPKARKCILVGYDENKYRVYVEDTGKIYTAINVHFIENDEEVHFRPIEEDGRDEPARNGQNADDAEYSESDSSPSDDDCNDEEEDMVLQDDDGGVLSADSDLMTEDELRLHIDPSELMTEDETMDETVGDAAGQSETAPVREKSSDSSSEEEKGMNKPLTLKTTDGTFRYKLVPVPGIGRSKIAIEQLSDGGKELNSLPKYYRTTCGRGQS